MHDGRIFRRSTIYKKAEAKEILTEPTVLINGQTIGPYLVGDGARVKVECAFGILKNRWRLPIKRFDSGLEFAVKINVQLPAPFCTIYVFNTSLILLSTNSTIYYGNNRRYIIT